MKLLAGDIGGTKTILQALEYRNKELHPIAEKRYHSQQFDTFERILINFYSEFGLNSKEVNAACIGVAGPVTQIGSRATSRITNLPWKLDSDELAEQFCAGDFHLINDFQAIGYGIEKLGDDDILSLQQATPVDKGVKAIIGAGTGLGQAFMVWDSGECAYKVHPSEAGHSSYSPVTDSEKQLLNYLSNKAEFVSLEQVVSGPGITNIYHSLSQQQSNMPSEIMLSANDSMDITPTIVKLALQDEDPLAVKTLEIFIHSYGVAAGNLALSVGATGGVYVAGGIAPKIRNKLLDGGFASAFNAKSKMKSWLQNIPVYLVLNENTGLLGAANYGLRSCVPPDA